MFVEETNVSTDDYNDYANLSKNDGLSKNGDLSKNDGRSHPDDHDIYDSHAHTTPTYHTASASRPGTCGRL